MRACSAQRPEDTLMNRPGTSTILSSLILSSRQAALPSSGVRPLHLRDLRVAKKLNPVR